MERIALRYAAFLLPETGACEAEVSITLEDEVLDGEQSAVLGVRDGAVVRIDLTVWQAMLRLRNTNALWAVEGLLKLICAYLALSHGGLLFHCAGLLRDGQVYLFTGRSGSGKTTVVALSPAAAALNDDMVVLRPEGDGWRAYGTPFWNVDTVARTGQTASGPVTGIFRLVQDRSDFVESVSPAVALSELVANCPVVNGDPVALPTVLERCRRLATTVPLQRLHFRRSPDFWAAVQGRSSG
jgi:hypothetical protein